MLLLHYSLIQFVMGTSTQYTETFVELGIQLPSLFAIALTVYFLLKCYEKVDHTVLFSTA